MEPIKAALNNNIELTTHEKIYISLKDISKAIKKKLKEEYPNSIFSIKTKYYAGGQSLHISILETDFKIIKPFSDISEQALKDYSNRAYSMQDLGGMQETKHKSISPINESESYNPHVWNNGIFLTESGFKLVKRITCLCNKFNWDNSDSQTDYYDVKFYLHISLGSCEKPYIETGKLNSGSEQ